jgi:hypothetical protein
LTAAIPSPAPVACVRAGAALCLDSCNIPSRPGAAPAYLYTDPPTLSNFHSQKIHKILKNKNLIFFKKYDIIILEKIKKKKNLTKETQL